MTTVKKLYSVLGPAQRRRAVMLLGPMLLGMVLEALGVSLVVPALAVMTQGDLASRYPVLAPGLARLGNPSRETLVVIGIVALVAVSAVKAAFLGYLAWTESRFSYRLQEELSERLFTGYLRQPYAFHLQRNSAQLIRATMGQVSELQDVVQSGLQLVSELFVMVGILALLVVVEPAGTLVVVVVLGGSGWAIYAVTRERSLRWGIARQRHEELRLRHLQQGFGGVKEVKLLGREANFVAQYAVHNTGTARVGQHQATVQALPRLWFEFLIALGLASLVLVMIAQGRPLDGVLVMLGLFAAAAFRLMPSILRVLNTVQTIRFSLPAVDTVYDEIRSMEQNVAPQSDEPLVLRGALDLRDISFRYPGADAEALCNISLSISRGTSVGFVGTTGAGKSTLVDIILGLLPPSAGEVLVDGVDVQTRLRRWQRQIGYVPQSVFLTDDTLRRNVAFGIAASEVDDAAVARAVRAAQLERFVETLPQGLDTVVGERGVRLSGGERQRVGIARALYHDPDVLVLDEATSSLDTATEAGVMDAVRAFHGDKTIIIIAHRLTTVAHCDRLFRLEHGHLVEEGEPRSCAMARC
jgi:ATP-binding cassette, subfamily B, bacterial PglK